MPEFPAGHGDIDVAEMDARAVEDDTEEGLQPRAASHSCRRSSRRHQVTVHRIPGSARQIRAAHYWSRTKKERNHV
jgi:hypothetical protein